MDRTLRDFTSGELCPAGWLKQQLELQADGLAGNLDRVWPDVRDSRWIGGDREGWERVPYWLDGFIPLAFLLRDDDRIARAKRYIDCILRGQREDGWLCPNGDVPVGQYDTWAVQLISKVLTVWYDCSGDERIPDALCRMLKNYYDLLSAGDIRLFDWGRSRWFETFPALNRLHELYPDAEWILPLARLLREQGTDWTALTERWKTPLNQWTQETHVVNLAMMLKYEAVSHKLLGEEYTDRAEELWQILMEYNGTPAGIFTGDECLSGRSPIQGTELCAVVELMYSLECLYAETGDAKWAERLEVVAFNALPASISEDMWSHQYVQMSNQIDCTPFGGNPPFGTNGVEAHLFGLEPNYGCCTANFGQGFPKLALSALLRSRDGLVAALPLPVALRTEWKGVPVCVEQVTEYPFRNTVTYRVTAEAETDLKLHLRIPSFAKGVTLNGRAVGRRREITLAGFPAGTSEWVLSFETIPKLLPSANGLYYVRCGSLVFSLPIREQWEKREYTRDGVERRFPYCDYLVTGHSPWNYAFASAKFERSETAGGKIPFSTEHPRVVLKAKLIPIDWGYEAKYDTVCAKIPHFRKPIGEEQTVTLIPYGCAKLRMTELPKVGK